MTKIRMQDSMTHERTTPPPVVKAHVMEEMRHHPHVEAVMCGVPLGPGLSLGPG